MFLFEKNSNLRLTLVRLKRNRLALLGFAILLVIFLLAVFADFAAPYGFSKQNLRARFQSPSMQHFFGTDEFGRDIFSRIVFGARISLQVGFLAVFTAMIAGGLLGAFSGYRGGRFDNIVMRFMDVVLSIPTMLLAIAIAAALGPGLFNLMIAVGLSTLPRFARIVRASVLSIKEQEFVEAARAMGASDWRIIVRHILPNCTAPIIVEATLGVAHAILSAASLSFIGLGIQPPYPEWGAMLSSARGYLRDYAYMSIFPGLAIMITILSLNFIGDGLRDAMDPKLKR